MLISESYRKQQEKLHQNPNYGVASLKFAPLVAKIVAQSGARTLLDFGAGKGRLAEGLEKHLPDDAEVGMTRYDPAIPAWSTLPEGTFDLVCCIDVLEHIEPECLDDVLYALASKTGQFAFLTVHTGPAVKVLDDGRNAHLIQQPPAWWMPKIFDRWSVATYQPMDNGFWVICDDLDRT
jgi:2-polyprenyl-3-methyl-5-hydroxy-6-metoxy-1,4-benzoquinol methylase